MAFWSSQRLEAELARLVDTPDPEQVDCNAVTLRVGEEIYITPDLEHAAPSSHTKQLLGPGAPIAIPPGQFSFLLTEEIVTIPPEVMGFISIKATFKSKGLVNVSGFHVDPGWNGRLIFAVFNAGPATIHLQRGMPLFLLWISELDAPSIKRKTKPAPPGIPPQMINNITGVVDSLYGLETRMKTALTKLADEDTKLSERIHKLNNRQIQILFGFAILGTIIGTLFGFLAKPLIGSLFDKDTAATASTSAVLGRDAASEAAKKPATNPP